MIKDADIPLLNRLIHFVGEEFSPGDKLPGERELAERFGVGRNQLREEMSRLEAFKLIQLRPKARAVVTAAAPSLERLARFSETGIPLPGREAQAAIEVRQINEIAAVRLACERATVENIARLSDILDLESEKVAAGEPIQEEDEAFHLEIIRATQNNILFGLLENFYALSRERRKHYFALHDRGVRSHRDHVDLFESIRNRDAETAVTLLSNHIGNAGVYWSRAFSS